MWNSLCNINTLVTSFELIVCNPPQGQYLYSIPLHFVVLLIFNLAIVLFVCIVLLLCYILSLVAPTGAAPQPECMFDVTACD